MRTITQNQENTTRRIVLILLCASILFGMIMGGMLFFRLSYLWGGIFLLSWIWFSSASRRIWLRRTIRASRAQIGQIFEEQYDIQNNSFFPIFWLELHDESPLPGSQGSYVVNLLRGKKARSFLIRTRLDKRGVYQLGPISLSYGDIFGLFRGHHKISDKATLIVYPILFEVRDFPIPPGLLSGGEASRRRTHQITPNAAGIREYSPGDPLNRIHWLSSIRRNQFMVKEFELDPSADIWIFIDSFRNTHIESVSQGSGNVDHSFWDWLPFSELPANSVPFVTDELRGNITSIALQPSTIEYCASIGASLANFFLRQGKAVGIVSMGHSLTTLPPDRTGRQLGKILEAFAFLRADGEIPLEKWGEDQARHMTRGSIIILITPSVQPSFTFFVDRLGHLGLRPVIVLLNAETFGGSSGSDILYANIKILGYPVYLVGQGEDLSSIFSMKR